MFAAYMIELRGQLYTTYPNPDLPAVPGGPECTSNTSMTFKYRTLDGTCNSKSMPLLGSTGMPFVRNLDSSFPRSDLPSVVNVAAILQRPCHETDLSIKSACAAPFNQIATAWTESPFHNTVTHWWDASQIYGSTQEQVAAIRVRDGKLHLDENDKLDYVKTKDSGNSEQKKPITWFGENFWVGLHMLHTLFARNTSTLSTNLNQPIQA